MVRKALGVESPRYGLDHSSCAPQLLDFGGSTCLSLNFLIWKQDGNVYRAIVRTGEHWYKLDRVW